MPNYTDQMRTIGIGTASRAYDVMVGSGARHQIGLSLPPSARLVIVHSSKLDPKLDLTREHNMIPFDDSESTKSLASVEQLCQNFATLGISRSDYVVGVGGGVITDTVGLAAALYHRGTPFIGVPTTLLGMVDASIGGKTGVNLAIGKNLLGTVTQPRAVFCDTDYLETLPKPELRSGLGEIAKHEIIAHEDWSQLDIDGLIEKSIQLKGSVVAEDETEAHGKRHILNLGHTLGHALEIETNFSIKHGEAVAIGIAYATQLALSLDRITPDRAKATLDILTRYDLPTTVPMSVDSDHLIDLMRRDKKSGGNLTFVLDSSDAVELVRDVPEQRAIETLNRFLTSGLTI